MRPFMQEAMGQFARVRLAGFRITVLNLLQLARQYSALPPDKRVHSKKEKRESSTESSSEGVGLSSLSLHFCAASARGKRCRLGSLILARLSGYVPRVV